MKTIQKAVIKKGNQYLVLLRHDKAKFFPGHWEFPGGKLKVGEGQFEGVEREVVEETSLGVKALEVVGSYEIEVLGETYQFLIYSIKILSGEVNLSDEHVDYKWVTKEELLKMKTDPSIRLFFEEYSN